MCWRFPDDDPCPHRDGREPGPLRSRDPAPGPGDPGGAQALVAFHEAIRDTLLREAPTLRPHVHVVGQTVLCNEKPYDLRATLDLSPYDLVLSHALLAKTGV